MPGLTLFPNTFSEFGFVRRADDGMFNLDWVQEKQRRCSAGGSPSSSQTCLKSTAHCLQPGSLLKAQLKT